ncbi:hypothetical protein [Amycolatopsis nigrescens]|uniref:hypothetical protein n=1 Tax=Amycolatopsis nigrescens TaxID=381445 RepID=UPI00036E40CE|nr:hypothetical protein [Amycolatopsis nigrescens]
MAERQSELTALRVILLFTLLTTTLHYTHNVVEIERYPQFEGLSLTLTQVMVVLGGLVFTAGGLIGYRRYRQGRHWPARAWLLVYSLAGLASLGHFLVGVPDVSAFWLGTIFTDVLSSLALWAFVVWSASQDRLRPAGLGSTQS